MTSLLLFCKRPMRGFGKQRLAREIGLEQAFQVSELLLECALEDLQSWEGPKILSPAGGDDREWAEELIHSRSIRDAIVIPQGEGNMGERIEVLDGYLREQGEQRIVIIGSDCPANQPVHFEEAVNLLDSHDIVLTPASDGGVTLMANRTPWPPLSSLPWSKDHFGESLVKCSKENGLSVGFTAGSSDTDTKEDLLAFAKSSGNDKRESRIALRTWIEENIR